MKTLLLLTGLLCQQSDWIGASQPATDWIGIDRQGADAGNAGNTAAAYEAPLPVFDIYAPSWCPSCPGKARAIQTGVRGTFRVHTRESEFPEWIADVGGAYPIIAWRGPTGGIVYINDYSSPDDVSKRYAKSMPVVPQADAGQSPTPLAEVRRVLAILHPQPHEVFVDYGCGDGRWLIEAAKTYGCRAVGIEIDPQQVDRARQAVDSAGLVGRVQIIEGDVLTENVEAQVGVAYLYPDLLAKLRPKLLKLNRFATPYHPVDGMQMQQNGDAWIWQRPAAVQQQPYAVYGGQAYYGRVCNNPRCQMCNAIQRQLESGGNGGSQTRQRSSGIFGKIFGSRS